MDTILLLAFTIQIASLVFQSVQTIYVNECSDSNLIITPLVASVLNGVSILLYGVYKFMQESKESMVDVLALATVLLWLTNGVMSSIAWGQSIHYDVTCPNLNKDVDVRLFSVLSTSFFVGSLFVFMYANADKRWFESSKQSYERVRRFSQA